MDPRKVAQLFNSNRAGSAPDQAIIIDSDNDNGPPPQKRSRLRGRTTRQAAQTPQKKSTKPAPRKTAAQRKAEMPPPRTPRRKSIARPQLGSTPDKAIAVGSDEEASVEGTPSRARPRENMFTARKQPIDYAKLYGPNTKVEVITREEHEKNWREMQRRNEERKKEEYRKRPESGLIPTPVQRSQSTIPNVEREHTATPIVKSTQPAATGQQMQGPILNQQPSVKKVQDKQPSASKVQDNRPSASKVQDNQPSASKVQDNQPSVKKVQDNQPSVKKVQDNQRSASKVQDNQRSASKVQDNQPSASKVQTRLSFLKVQNRQHFDPEVPEPQHLVPTQQPKPSIRRQGDLHHGTTSGTEQKTVERPAPTIITPKTHQRIVQAPVPSQTLPKAVGLSKRKASSELDKAKHTQKRVHREHPMVSNRPENVTMGAVPSVGSILVDGSVAKSTTTTIVEPEKSAASLIGNPAPICPPQRSDLAANNKTAVEIWKEKRKDEYLSFAEANRRHLSIADLFVHAKAGRCTLFRMTTLRILEDRIDAVQRLLESLSSARNNVEVAMKGLSGDTVSSTLLLKQSDIYQELIDFTREHFASLFFEQQLLKEALPDANRENIEHILEKSRDYLRTSVEGFEKEMYVLLKKFSPEGIKRIASRMRRTFDGEYVLAEFMRLGFLET